MAASLEASLVERQRAALNRYHDELTQEKLPTLEILQLLVRHDVFDVGGVEYEEIVSAPLAEHRRRAELLLHHLSYRGQTAFDRFVDALRTVGRNDLAELLKELCSGSSTNIAAVNPSDCIAFGQPSAHPGKSRQFSPSNVPLTVTQESDLWQGPHVIAQQETGSLPRPSSVSPWYNWPGPPARPGIPNSLNTEMISANRAVKTESQRQREHPTFLGESRLFHELAYDCILCFVRQKQKSELGALSNHLYELAQEMYQTRPDKFRTLCSILELDNLEMDFLDTAKHLFQDNGITSSCHWGRIVAFVVFGMCMGRKCVENKTPNKITTLVVLMQKVAVEENLLLWIRENGGWESFYHGCREPSSLWSQYKTYFICGGLLVLAVVLMRAS